MTTPALVQSFRHRENLDGTWDSICLRCYVTAAHSHQEAVLAQAELRHHCDEMSWLYKEPMGSGGRPMIHGRRAGLASVPSRTYAFAYFSGLRGGRPAGLREQSEA